MKQLLPLLIAASVAVRAPAQHLEVGGGIGLAGWQWRETYSQPGERATGPAASLFARWEGTRRWSLEAGLGYSGYWLSNSLGSYTERYAMSLWSVPLKAVYRLTRSGQARLQQQAGLVVSLALLREVVKTQGALPFFCLVDLPLHLGPPVQNRFTVWTGLQYALRYRIADRVAVLAEITAQVEPGLWSQQHTFSQPGTPYARLGLTLGAGWRLR